MKSKTEGIIQFHKGITIAKQPVDNANLSFAQKILDKYGITRQTGKNPTLIFQLYRNLFTGRTGVEASGSSEIINYANHLNVYKSFVNLIMRTNEPIYSGNKNQIPAGSGISQHEQTSIEKPSILNHRFSPVMEALYRSKTDFGKYNKPGILHTAAGTNFSQDTFSKSRYGLRKSAGNNIGNSNAIYTLRKAPEVQQVFAVEKEADGPQYSVAANKAKERNTEKNQYLLKTVSPRKLHGASQHWSQYEEGYSSVDNYVNTRVAPQYHRNLENPLVTQAGINQKVDTDQKVYYKNHVPGRGRAYAAPDTGETAWRGLEDGFAERASKVSVEAALPKQNIVRLKEFISKNKINYGSRQVVLTVRKKMTAAIRPGKALKILKTLTSFKTGEYADIQSGLIFNESVIRQTGLTEQEPLNVFAEEQEADNQILKAHRRLQHNKSFIIQKNSINKSKNNIAKVQNENTESMGRPINDIDNRLIMKDALHLQQDKLAFHKPAGNKAAALDTDWITQDVQMKGKEADTKTFTAPKQSKSIDNIEAEEINQLAERVYRILEKRIAIHKDRRGLR